MPDKTHTLAAVSLIRETYTCYSISDPRRSYLLQYTWWDTYSYCSISYPRRLHVLQHLWAKTLTLAAVSLIQDTYTCCSISEPRYVHLLQHLWAKTLTLAAVSLILDTYTCCSISDPRHLHLLQHLWAKTFTLAAVSLILDAYTWCSISDQPHSGDEEDVKLKMEQRDDSRLLPLRAKTAQTNGLQPLASSLVNTRGNRVSTSWWLGWKEMKKWLMITTIGRWRGMKALPSFRPPTRGAALCWKEGFAPCKEDNSDAGLLSGGVMKRSAVWTIMFSKTTGSLLTNEHKFDFKKKKEKGCLSPRMVSLSICLCI